MHAKCHKNSAKYQGDSAVLAVAVINYIYHISNSPLEVSHSLHLFWFFLTKSKHFTKKKSEKGFIQPRHYF